VASGHLAYASERELKEPSLEQEKEPSLKQDRDDPQCAEGASGSAPAGRHSAYQRTISVLRIVEPFPMTKRQLYADIAARHTPEGIKVVTLAKGALASRYRMPRRIRPAHRADQWTSNSTPAG